MQKLFGFFARRNCNTIVTAIQAHAHYRVVVAAARYYSIEIYVLHCAHMHKKLKYVYFCHFSLSLFPALVAACVIAGTGAVCRFVDSSVMGSTSSRL